MLFFKSTKKYLNSTTSSLKEDVDSMLSINKKRKYDPVSSKSAFKSGAMSTAIFLAMTVYSAYSGRYSTLWLSVPLLIASIIISIVCYFHYVAEINSQTMEDDIENTMGK